MKRIVCAIASALCFAPLLAQAGDAVVAADITLQSGPDSEYPQISDLAAGTQVAVEGCIDGWTWCDVIAGGDRGWVPGTYLEENYQGQNVVIVDYGPRINIPIVTFSIGGYWDHYYRSRPFYAQRTEWEHRDIHPHAPPRAPVHTTQPRPQDHRDARAVNDAHPQNAAEHHDGKPVNQVQTAPRPPQPVAATPHAPVQHTEHAPPPKPAEKPVTAQTAQHAPPPPHEAAPKPPQPRAAPKAEPKPEPKKEPPKEEKHEGGG